MFPPIVHLVQRGLYGAGLERRGLVPGMEALLQSSEQGEVRWEGTPLLGQKTRGPSRPPPPP